MILSAQPFAMYHATWWAYVGCGIIFLLMVWWKVRKWNFYGQWTLLSFFAAGAFSFSQVPDATTYAPAAIALILELENEGPEGEIAMLTLLFLVWLIIWLLGVSAKFGWAYYQERNQSKLNPENSTERQEPQA
ncbi:hypothetical protein [Pleionea sediminis]|uniref:hypothetical protein n=1 Tax=Pleionea sediminis TaxID=2569479 RepID=UPI001185204A|nr:hypothetical protein [Pleionea sediminis]